MFLREISPSKEVNNFLFIIVTDTNTISFTIIGPATTSCWGQLHSEDFILL